MRRQGIVWLGATIAILGAAACFSDPTSSSRNGASRLQITELTGTSPLQSVGTLATVNMGVNDTITLQIRVRDTQGNYYPFAAPTLGTASSAVATLVNQPDSSKATAPGNPYWLVWLVGTGSGTTTATVTAGGVTDTFAVIVP